MKGVQIQESIINEYLKLRPTTITNYSGITGFEADVMMISNSGFAYEYEVKTSRADFKKDFTKKAKHKNLMEPKMPRKSKYCREYPLAPSYFYYVCVDGLIKKNEVPKYAGLIYIVNGIPVVIKKGVRLHSNKVPDKLIRNLCKSLSARTHHGSSYIRHIHGS